MSETWSYITGKRNRNRVRVYERYPGSPIQIKWTDEDGHEHRKSLRAIDDEPIYERGDAVKVADRVALRLKENRVMGPELRSVLGLPERHTLEELCKEIWAVKYDEWDEEYQTDQDCYRDFWYEHLGKDTYLRSITPSDVEKAANKAAQARDWSAGTKRHYLDFIKSSFNYARDDLSWITSMHDLKAVDLPKPDPKQLAYEVDELFRLIDAAGEIDLRLHALALIAYVTLRRMGAILETRVDALQERLLYGERRTVLVFPGETDKSDNTAYAVLPPTTADVLERLAEKPAVKSTGLLFVRGPLDDPDPPEHKQKPLAGETVTEWWHDAEEEADVAWVKGRAIHGIKRRVTTIAKEQMGSLSEAAHQSNTDEKTLEEIYLRDNPGPKCALADTLEGYQKKWAQST